MVEEDTLADRLGVGLRLDSDFDFVAQGGSLDLLSGIDVLGRDLAFALSTELEAKRGDLAAGGQEFAEDVRIIVRRVARADSRVAEIVDPIEVDPEFGGPAEARVEVELVAETGDRGKAILKP